MLVDLKTRTETPEVMELLGYAAFGDPDQAAQAAGEYQRQAALRLLGWEEDGVLVGLVGFEETEDGSMDIRHIAVLPENRGKGYGRGLILESLSAAEPRYVVAETEDELTADFFRRLGFMVYSLGESTHGIEQFRCVYEIEENEDL